MSDHQNDTMPMRPALHCNPAVRRQYFSDMTACLARCRDNMPPKPDADADIEVQHQYLIDLRVSLCTRRDIFAHMRETNKRVISECTNPTTIATLTKVDTNLSASEADVDHDISTIDMITSVLAVTRDNPTGGIAVFEI